MGKLKIVNLTVSIDGKTILDDFNLEINDGEIHAIMGPNGTGKSTLAKVIMGDPKFKIISGDIYFDDVKINDLSVDKRSNLGIFLGMQMPTEIDGVTNADFLRTALHSRDKEKFSLFSFVKSMNSVSEDLKMHKDMSSRFVNKGFSGGEKKKNEVLQMYMLKPKSILLDEIDSGLDVDSLSIVGNSVMDYYNEHKPSMLVITHYSRLLNYIKPDYVHIISEGRIIASGDNTLVEYIEKNGYSNNNKLKEKFGCYFKEVLKNE